MKKSRPSVGTPPKCKEHPFFHDLPEMFEQRKTFYSHIFFSKATNFENYSFGWVRIKKVILEELLLGVTKARDFYYPGGPITTSF